MATIGARTKDFTEKNSYYLAHSHQHAVIKSADFSHQMHIVEMIGRQFQHTVKFSLPFNSKSFELKKILQALRLMHLSATAKNILEVKTALVAWLDKAEQSTRIQREFNRAEQQKKRMQSQESIHIRLQKEIATLYQLALSREQQLAEVLINTGIKKTEGVYTTNDLIKSIIEEKINDQTAEKNLSLVLIKIYLNQKISELHFDKAILLISIDFKRWVPEIIRQIELAQLACQLVVINDQDNMSAKFLPAALITLSKLTKEELNFCIQKEIKVLIQPGESKRWQKTIFLGIDDYQKNDFGINARRLLQLLITQEKNSFVHKK